MALSGGIVSCNSPTPRMVDCVAGYHNAAGPGSRCVPDTPAGTSTAPGEHVTPRTGIPYRFLLLTHCGITEARLGNVYLEADHPLVGAGNPPDGWSNPYQRGTMTLLSPHRAVFHDDAGHSVRFHARVHASAFERICD